LVNRYPRQNGSEIYKNRHFLFGKYSNMSYFKFPEYPSQKDVACLAGGIFFYDNIKKAAFYKDRPGL